MNVGAAHLLSSIRCLNMKHTYYFSLMGKEKEVSVEGTAITLDEPHIFIVKDGNDEVARFYKKEVQGYRRISQR